MEIKNYNDLQAFINTLTEEQRKQPPIVSNLDGLPKPIVEAGVTEEHLLVHIEDGDNVGTEKELRALYGEWLDITKYKIAAPSGEVFLYIE